MQDLYEILGVSKTATDGEIRKAFLKLAKKHHPDVNPGNKEAETKFKEVNLAYEVLKDGKKRAQYDGMRAMGANPFARGAGGGNYPPPGFGGAEGFQDFGLGDLFEEIFGGARSPGARRPGGGRGRAHGFAARGADREAALTVSFQEAARGAERLLEFSGGKKVSVQIPEGVETGSRIKLTGQGDPGFGGGPPGDLLLVVTVQAHPYLVREGNNLLLRLPISVREALLGAEVEVPTLDGKVILKIPKGVSSGQRLKLSGRGVRAQRSGTRGDLFVEMQIKVPKELDDAHQAAAAALERTAFNPRQGLFG